MRNPPFLNRCLPECKLYSCRRQVEEIITVYYTQGSIPKLLALLCLNFTSWRSLKALGLLKAQFGASEKQWGHCTHGSKLRRKWLLFPLSLLSKIHGQPTCSRQGLHVCLSALRVDLQAVCCCSSGSCSLSCCDTKVLLFTLGTCWLTGDWEQFTFYWCLFAWSKWSVLTLEGTAPTPPQMPTGTPSASKSSQIPTRCDALLCITIAEKSTPLKQETLM